MGSSGGGSGGSSSTISGGEQYCLRWNNHQNNLLGVFSQLLRDESLVDVTLACSEGLSIRAHKVVLSACSSYFQALFLDHPSRHPIVILKDVRFTELRTLIDFMYKGEVNVEYCQLSALLKTAESLKVKGLAEMTREYKPSPEQVEPKELVTRRSHNPSRPLTPEDPPEKQPQHSPPAPQTWRICNASPQTAGDGDPKECVDRDKEKEEKQMPHAVESGECVLALNSNHLGVAATCSSVGQPGIYSRMSSPLDCQSLPGPSNLPPVQQVPLSLKKEADWGGGEGGGGGGGGDEIKPPRESPTDYSRNSQDSEHPEESDATSSSPRLYPCMYCGNTFPHQSKLTRHILSHSLETLKYRERHAPAPPTEPIGYADPPMETELAEAVGGSGVVLCKFCGKSFPDVGSLIAHLPVHTGDRPFKCEFCGKAFKLRHHMKDHCRVHTGERPFRCALCGKTFSRSTILKAHEKTHYPKYVRKFLSPSPLDNEEDNPH